MRKAVLERALRKYENELSEEDTLTRNQKTEMLNAKQRTISDCLKAIGEIPKFYNAMPHKLNDRRIESQM